jgi:DNA-nicking Smr family endonuclease
MKNKTPPLNLDMNALLDRYPPEGKKKPVATEKSRSAPKKTQATEPVAILKSVNFAEMIDLYPIKAKKEQVDLHIARNQPRNNLRIERTLDLHGDTRKEAECTVENFLKRCYNDHIRCVRIIHGKGKHSKTGTAILKHYLQSTLECHPLVLKTTSAGFHDGQSGATIVILKSNHH